MNNEKKYRIDIIGLLILLWFVPVIPILLCLLVYVATGSRELSVLPMLIYFVSWIIGAAFMMDNA